MKKKESVDANKGYWVCCPYCGGRNMRSKATYSSCKCDSCSNMFDAYVNKGVVTVDTNYKDDTDEPFNPVTKIITYIKQLEVFTKVE